MQQAVEQQLMQAAQVVEQQLDAEISKLENLEEDDLESLRKKRIQAMKKAQQQKQEWLAQGHGQYEEIPEEKEFFEVCKKNQRVAVHFYRDSTMRCKIVDMHMAALAPKHLETKFCKINAEKCPFLVQRLKIKVLPTICLAKDGKTVDWVIGFDDLGGVDDFPTEMLEWRLGHKDIVHYQGDLMTPPWQPNQKKSILGNPTKKTIRGGDDESSDEDDW